jgi:Transposase DDE domain group 1
MQHNGWDHALKVTADGTGLVAHAGAILLRKTADQAGLTAWLGSALRHAGKSPLFDRGAALVSMAVAIALGATSMSDIAVLAHLSPVLGDAPSGPTIRRALDLAGGTAMLERIAKARAKARAHVWKLVSETPAGFPRLAIAGKTLTGWVVIDMDATLVTASSTRNRQLRRGRRPGASTRWPASPTTARTARASRWPSCCGSGEPLAIMLRPGNAGSNTAADRVEATRLSLAQLPGRLRRRVLIRTDSGGGTHEFLAWLASPGRRLPAHPARQSGHKADPQPENGHRLPGRPCSEDHERFRLVLHLPEYWHREAEWHSLFEAACGPPPARAA